MLTYALPISCVRVDSSVTETEDTVLAKGKPERVPTTAVVLHVAGAARDQAVKLPTGWFRNTSAKFELTEDGRLRSGSSESAGQLGKIVIGLGGAAATVAGLFAGGPAAGLSAVAGAAVGGAERAAVELPQIDAQTEEQIVQAAYENASKDAAALRRCYRNLVEKVVLRIAAVSQQIVEGTEPARWSDVNELRRLQELLPSLRAELDRSEAQFKAWRATTITTHTATYQRCFTLDALRGACVVVSSSNVDFGSHAHPSVREAWNDLGVVIEIAGDPRTPDTPAPETRTNEILVRVPYRARLNVYEKVDGKPVLRESRPHLLTDSTSPTEIVRLRRSLWSKRSVALGFGDLGVLTSYEQGSDSSAAALAETLGQLPTTAAGGLEQASKLRTHLSALRDADLTAARDRAKKEVELKQQELTAKGLLATEKDHAELERLIQQASMLEKRTALAEPTAVASELAALKSEAELLEARRAVSVAARTLAAETELAALRGEIERLRDQAAAAQLRDGKRKSGE